MTKKDYDIVAACVGAEQAREGYDKRTLDSICTRLLLEFRLENPKFNGVIFWKRVEYWRQVHSGE